MSAFMVSHDHIDAMVELAISGPSGSVPSAWTRPFYYYWSAPGTSPESRYVTDETADAIGQMLARENARSLRARYQSAEDMIAAWADSGYEYVSTRMTPYRKPTAVEGLSILACYEYQSCESDDWPTSEAARFCEALRNALIRRLPGYDAAPWEWERTT